MLPVVLFGNRPFPQKHQNPAQKISVQGFLIQITPCLPDGLGIFRGGDTKFLLKLTGEVMHRRILQRSGNFREIHFVFPDHMLALLKIAAADILAGGNLQIIVEQ